MKTSEIKGPLIEAQETLAAAGSAAAAKDIGELVSLVDAHSDLDFEQFIEHIRSKLDPAAAKASMRAGHVADLRRAKLDEAVFFEAFSRLAAETQFDKADILAIAKDYGVIRILGRSKGSYLESIEAYFHWMLYNHDANEMAKRATPW